MSLLEILCSLCSSCVLLVLHVFFVFKGLWWKFFGALEASICRTSLICGFLKFLEAFELDSSEFWDLGRWFEWFCFEYSLYSRLKFLKFLEALGLDSMIKAFVLLNLLWCCLWHGVFQDVFVSSKISSKMFWFVFVCRNALGRLLFIRVWGWVSDMWWSLIDDMCHSLIGGVLRLFLQDTWYQLIGQMYWFSRRHMLAIDWIAHVIAYTRWCVAYVITYTCRCVIWFLHAFYVFISMTLGKFLLVFEWW